MYILKTEDSFDSAHFLMGYNGKCKNIHGHRWRVVLEIMTKELHGADNEQLNGMHVDFTKLKADLKTEVDKMDHCFFLQKGSLKKRRRVQAYGCGFQTYCGKSGKVFL